MMFAVVEITTKNQQPPYDISTTVTVSNNVDLSKVNVTWISEGENLSMPAIEERRGEIIKSHIVANHSQLPVKLAVTFEENSCGQGMSLLLNFWKRLLVSCN